MVGQDSAAELGWPEVVAELQDAEVAFFSPLKFYAEFTLELQQHTNMRIRLNVDKHVAITI